MKNLVESLMEDDHASLDRLLTELDAELAKPNPIHAFELLDIFWARLAVHIRAENLHLFPALAGASASRFTGGGSLPTSEDAQSVLTRLKSDHDFFMKELAEMVKTMRETVGVNPVQFDDTSNLRRRLAAIANRLEAHNRLEEQQVYTWPSLVFDEQALAKLCVQLRRELENLPPRFAEDIQLGFDC